jgi:hypothetical protein
MANIDLNVQGALQPMQQQITLQQQHLAQVQQQLVLMQRGQTQMQQQMQMQMQQMQMQMQQQLVLMQQGQAQIQQQQAHMLQELTRIQFFTYNSSAYAPFHSIMGPTMIPPMFPLRLEEVLRLNTPSCNRVLTAFNVPANTWGNTVAAKRAAVFRLLGIRIGAVA